MLILGSFRQIVTNPPLISETGQILTSEGGIQLVPDVHTMKMVGPAKKSIKDDKRTT